MIIFKPIVLWQGWADGAERRAVLTADRTEIETEIKRIDALGDSCWQREGDRIKKFDQPVIFAALVGLGSKPDH